MAAPSKHAGFDTAPFVQWGGIGRGLGGDLAALLRDLNEALAA